MASRSLFAPIALAIAIPLAGVSLNVTKARAQADRNLLLSIGVESGDSAAEFSNAGSAVRLSNGDIVIANSASSQIRWFNSAGKFVRTLGRRGKGPNEFGRSISVCEGGADTVIVLDSGNDRIHYIDPKGNFVRSDSLGSLQRASWIYDRTIVELVPSNVDIERLRSVAAGIPFRQGEIARRAIADRVGNLWVRDQIGGGAWTGYGAVGRTIGALNLPASFEPYQILDTLVLGRDRDALGVERIQLRRLVRTAGQYNSASTPRPLYDAAVERATHGKLIASMKADLRNLVTAQELHFARNRKYSASLDALSFKASSDVLVRIVQFTEVGYWLAVSHPSLRTTCMFAVGVEWPMGVVQDCG